MHPLQNINDGISERRERAGEMKLEVDLPVAPWLIYD